MAPFPLYNVEDDCSRGVRDRDKKSTTFVKNAGLKRSAINIVIGGAGVVTQGRAELTSLSSLCPGEKVVLFKSLHGMD